MRLLVAVLLLVAPALADQDEAAKLIKQAAKLEKKAEALLDQGRRAAAFETLARAADLRHKARELRTSTANQNKANVKPPIVRPTAGTMQPTAQLQPEAKAKAKTKPKQKPRSQRESPGRAANAALKRMDNALQAGDLQKAADNARQARKALARWAKALEQRERRAGGQPQRQAASDKAIAKRITALEQQVRELRKLLDADSP